MLCWADPVARRAIALGLDSRNPCTVIGCCPTYLHIAQLLHAASAQAPSDARQTWAGLLTNSEPPYTAHHKDCTEVRDQRDCQYDRIVLLHGSL